MRRLNYAYCWLLAAAPLVLAGCGGTSSATPADGKSAAEMIAEGEKSLAGGDFNDAFSALPDILPDLGTVSAALATDKGRDFAALLRSANNLSTAFAGRQEKIGQLLRKLDVTLDALNADKGQALADTLKTAPRSLRDARGALRSLDRPLLDTKAATT